MTIYDQINELATLEDQLAKMRFSLENKAAQGSSGSSGQTTRRQYSGEGSRTSFSNESSQEHGGGSKQQRKQQAQLRDIRSRLDRLVSSGL